MAPQAQLEDPDEYSGGGLWIDRVLLSLLMAMCGLGEGLTALQQANLSGVLQMWPFATNSKWLRKMWQGVSHHLLSLQHLPLIPESVCAQG